MKKSILFLLSMLLLPVSVFSGSWSDEANLVSVNKKYQDHVVRIPYQDCYTQKYYETKGDNSATNEVLGGIVGGVVGNQFGKGSGKDAMTVAGVVLGASIANDRERKNNRSLRSRQVCDTKYQTRTEQRFSHYLVEYQYQGRKLTGISKNYPDGKRIKVRVNVSIE